MTTEITTPEAKIEQIKADIVQLQQNTNIEVIDQETANQASNMLGEIKTRYKRIEELRKFFTTPLNDQIKRINNMFKMQLEPLADMETQVKSSLQKYLIAEEKKRQEEAEKIRKEEEKQRQEQEKEMEKLKEKAEKTENEDEKKQLEEKANQIQEEAENFVPEVVTAPQKNIRTEAGLVSQKKVTKFEVIDKSKLPLEFLIPDEVKIRKAVNEGRQITGVRIYEDIQISVRA